MKSSFNDWHRNEAGLPEARLLCGLLLAVALGSNALAAGPPQAEIANGQIRLKLYLPDSRSGYYRGTRFDWSGVIGSLKYKEHEYYGPWFDGVDPAVHDYQYEGPKIIASTCSGMTGPAEEFTALGWDEAVPGGTFVKIGVGVLRKDKGSYDYVKQYEIVDPGKWSVVRHRDSVEFTQELTDPASGYGYIYRKMVRLVAGKPGMVLEHRLQNTGRRPIRTAVYDHNFLVLDRQPIGPDFVVAFPFAVQSPHPPDPGLAELRGKQFVFLKLMQGEDRVEAPLQGFGDSFKDNDIRVENRKVGAGVRITGDRPLSRVNLWSIRTVLAVEPFITITIDPGRQFSWNDSYEYYTLAPSSK
jgi:hypothetical protein